MTGSKGRAVSLLRAEAARWPGSKRIPTVEGFLTVFCGFVCVDLRRRGIEVVKQ
jgi:hypothetical protein